MAEYTTTESWAVDDLEPALVMHVFEREGNALHDWTGGSNVRFNMMDYSDGSMKITDATTGASVLDAATGKLQYVWQSGDTDTAGRYRAWFVVEVGGKDITTTFVEVLIEAPEKRRF